MPKIGTIKIENKEYAIVSWQNDDTHCKIVPYKESMEEGETFYAGHVVNWEFNHIDGYIKDHGKILKFTKVELDDFQVEGMLIQKILDSTSGIRVHSDVVIGVYGYNLPKVQVVSGVAYASGVANNPFEGSLWLAHSV